MASGSALWVSAISLHLGNQEATGKEPRSIFKNDKRHRDMKAVALGGPAGAVARALQRGGCKATRSSRLVSLVVVVVVVVVAAAEKPLVL